jgi:hypothetical protein
MQQQHPPQQPPHHQQSSPAPAPPRPGVIKPEDTAGDSGAEYSSRQSSQQVGGPTPGEDVEMQER